MSMFVYGNRSRYQFEGPFATADELQDRPGVYVILDERGVSDQQILDVGQSATVKTRVKGHDRVACWQQHQKGQLRYCAHYTPSDVHDAVKESYRLIIEQDIRLQNNPTCGEK